MSKARELLEMLDFLSDKNPIYDEYPELDEAVALYTFLSDVHVDFLGKDKDGNSFDYTELDMDDARDMDRNITAHCKDALHKVEGTALRVLKEYCGRRGLPEPTFVGLKLDKKGLITTVAFNEKLVSQDLQKLTDMLASEFAKGFGDAIAADSAYSFKDTINVDEPTGHQKAAMAFNEAKKYRVPVTFDVYIHPWYKGKWNIKLVK